MISFVLIRDLNSRKFRNDNFINSNRAYDMIRQDEAIEDANNKWWSKLKLLS